MEIMPEGLHRSVLFLINAQVDGQWRDYDLPVGISTEWATAYIGWALAEVACCWNASQARQSAQQAARSLIDQRTYKAGWGYNGITGPDTDSTACAIALFDTLELPVRDEDRAVLRAAWRGPYGFTTYPDGEGAWSNSHLDILWPALQGAHFLDFDQHCDELQVNLKDNFNNTEGWHGYWWNDPWYCSYHTLLALNWLDQEHAFCITPPAGPLNTNSYSSAAWMAGSLVMSGRIGAGRELFRQIMTQRRADGSWNSSADLRVTNPDISDPHNNSEAGTLYADQNRLMTTASILRAYCTESLLSRMHQSKGRQLIHGNHLIANSANFVKPDLVKVRQVKPIGKSDKHSAQHTRVNRQIL